MKKELESLGGAVSFPFIKDDFALFLKQLEKKQSKTTSYVEITPNVS